MKSAVLLKSFIAVGMMYLLLLLSGNEDFAWWMKPILLPFLIAAVAASKSFPTKSVLVLALLFSWFGDIVLLFSYKAERYFILGLVMFLIAHLFYIVLFIRQPIKSKGNQRGLGIGIVLIAAYIFALLFVLFPTLGGLKIPVLLYALVISAMLLMTVKGFSRWESPANYYLLAGAICFVSSDSLLAFDKFYNPIPLASFNIMSTYLSAQFLIAFGILILNKKQHSVLSENAAI